MRAVSRFRQGLLAAALGLAPVAALAQQTPVANSTTNAPASDLIGPQELQNFSLSGTATHPADQTAPAPSPASTPPPQTAAPKTVTSAPEPTPTIAAQTAPSGPPRSSPVRTADGSAKPSTSQARPPVPQLLAQTPPSSSVTVALPRLDKGVGTADSQNGLQTAAPTSFAPAPETPGSLSPGHGFPLLPWLFAALLLGAGGAFLFWRSRSRAAFAGGPHIDAFTAPTPVPTAAPRRIPETVPPPAAPPASQPLGLVSTRLRAWMEIGFLPLQCILDDDQITVEFDLELFNSGSVPARAVLAEAALFNAGPKQDQEIAAFFANPVGAGERIAVIGPLKRIAVRTKVVAPRAHFQSYELGGRQVFVPVIAFNVLYSSSGTEAQTSVSFLLGGDTNGDKMAPFRIDLGSRVFRGVTGRLLPSGVRR